MVNYTELKSAWDTLKQEKKVEASKVRDLVALSWKRCLDKGLSPFKYSKDNVNNRGKVRFQDKELISVSENLIEKLINYNQEDLNYIIVLADKEGLIFKNFATNKIVLNRGESFGLREGEKWDESSKGTNAIGTAIMEKKPLQIRGVEHFCGFFHDLTTAAVPIFCDNEKLRGIVSIAGFSKQFSRVSLDLTIFLASAINKQLELQHYHRQYSFCHKNINSIIESMSDGLLLVDKNKMVYHVNSRGAQILDLEKGSCLNRDLDNIIYNNSKIINVLKKGKGFSNKEVMLETPEGRKKVSLSVEPITNDADKIEGLMVLLNRIKTSKNTVGSYAKFTFDDIIANSPKMTRAINVARMAAKNDSTILLSGASGTGKEMFAQAIHNHSPRRHNPFVAINVGAIPRDLAESEFFGYVEGAFTGAQKGGKAGKFELANGGTIFLDEIGDMSLSMQQNLLRVLQEREVTRIGGKKAIPIDVRIVSATKKDLEKEVEKGKFREDLYYRLNVIYIRLPDLKDREGDIEQLVDYLIPKLSRKLEINPKDVSAETMQLLKNYDWPGNVRELENALEGVITFAANDEIILPEHLPRSIRKAASRTDSNNQEISSLKKTEKREILKALDECDGNISQTARVLGIARNTLYRKLSEYDINTDN